MQQLNITPLYFFQDALLGEEFLFYLDIQF